MARPHLSEIDSWSNHEARVLEVFTLALELLIEQPELPKEEVDINRKLYFCIHRANRTLSKGNGGLICPPSFDSKNPPDADDEKRSKREDKRPDFSCGIYDDQETEPDRSAKFYVVECKRLGLPSSPTWILNKNYVSYGIIRFVNPDWGYGKSASSGAMVGYVQSMELSDIFSEVNCNTRNVGLGLLVMAANGLQDNGVSRLEQDLNRLEIRPSQFRLRHLWVDIRARKSKN